jgi:hypothetical protein
MMIITTIMVNNIYNNNETVLELRHIYLLLSVLL